ncbi:MAG: hypothetical protein KDB27_04070 [Planctomycetales bacterium]|nr:hypothetical protein [Planctomycetales bacterium]
MKVRYSLLATLLAIVTAVGCSATGSHNLPPATQLAQPGPGVGGPGPGVLTPPMPPMGGGGPGMAMAMAPNGSGVMQASAVMPAQCYEDAGPGAVAQEAQYAQVMFARPEGMNVHWDTTGSGNYDSAALVVPGRQSFQQGGIYRLKVTNIAGRDGVELYPSIEIGPPNYRTAAYLAHSAIPIQFTGEDFDQVLSGNFVTKVIYLPDPEFQALAVAGVETLVSTRLDPDQDPIVEAENKGAILAVLRIGNKDMETPDAGYASPAIMQASFATPGVRQASCTEDCGVAGGCAGCQVPDMPMVGPTGPPGMPPGFVSGVTAPQYGMAMSGTPIGLPGPPHVPLGVPAGLQRHVMTNRTRVNMPEPTRQMNITVRQRPGMSYPNPPNRISVREDMIHPSVRFSQQSFGGYNGQGPYNCPPGQDCF